MAATHINTSHLPTSDIILSLLHMRTGELGLVTDRHAAQLRTLGIVTVVDLVSSLLGKYHHQAPGKYYYKHSTQQLLGSHLLC